MSSVVSFRDVASSRGFVVCTGASLVLSALALRKLWSSESKSGTKVSQRALASSGGGSQKWAEITALAKQPGVINMGQGFPDFPIPSAATNGVRVALEQGASNQYTAIGGTERITKALSALYHRMYPTAKGEALDAQKEICITASGTEALFASVLATVDPGDEVVLFEPFFPWYLTHIKMAGGVPKVVTLKGPTFDLLSVEKEMRAAFSSKTKLCIFNTPHNPTGHCASAEELELLASLCREHDVLCLADEVYEVCVFAGAKHQRICEVEGMWERTLTIGSASKMFSVTGWRVGWVTGPADLVEAVRTAHSYTSFCAPSLLQEGVAAAMEAEVPELRFDNLAELIHGNWELLAAALRRTGVDVCPADGGYFLVADVRKTGKSDIEYCKWLAAEAKIAAIPMNFFFAPREGGGDWCHLVRFAVCKERGYIERAINALNSVAV